MRKLASFLIMFVIFTSIVTAQQKKSDKLFSEVRLSKSKPGVYISYERARKRTPLETGESDEGIWLRLHNNTRWTIIFPAFDVPEIYGDVGMYYTLKSTTKDNARDAENGTNLPKGYELGHVYSTYELGAGESVLFSVPRNHLPNGSILQVKFSYAWENQDDVFADREAQHYVVFQASKLP